MGTVTSVMQAAALAHQTEHPTCVGILLTLVNSKIIKTGAGVQEVFGCPVYHFKSNKTVLFKEIPWQKSSRIPCELNVALQLVLYDTSVSRVGTQRLSRLT